MTVFLGNRYFRVIPKMDRTPFFLALARRAGEQRPRPTDPWRFRPHSCLTFGAAPVIPERKIANPRQCQNPNDQSGRGQAPPLRWGTGVVARFYGGARI